MKETLVSNLLDSLLQQIAIVMQRSETTEENKQGKTFWLAHSAAETQVFQQQSWVTGFKEKSHGLLWCQLRGKQRRVDAVSISKIGV